MKKQSIKLLLIEDDREDVLLIKDILENSHHSFRIKHCSSLKEAEKLLSPKQFDAILVDLNLPDSQGLDTLNQLSAIAPAIPKVVLTSINDPELIGKIIEAGAQDYVPKQILPADFIERVILHAMERQKLFQKISNREKLTTQILQEINTGILLIDQKGKVMFSNRAAETISGKSASGLETILTQYVSADQQINEIELISFAGHPLLLRLHRAEINYQDQPAILITVEDITERSNFIKALKQKEALLEAINQIARQLLRTPAWQTKINRSLALLGQATGVDRVLFVQVVHELNGGWQPELKFEWVAPDIQPLKPTWQKNTFSESVFKRLEQELSLGKPIYGALKDFSAAERKFFSARNVQAMLAVPIFVNEVWWGILGFDACRKIRQWNSEEIKILQTAAEIIGAAIQRDENEKKLLESAGKIKTFIEATPLGIIMEKDGKIIFANQQFVKMLGKKAEHEVLGLGLNDVIRQEDVEEALADLKSLKKKKDGIQEAEFKLIRDDGSAQVVEGLTTTVDPEQGIYMVFMKDITGRKETERELERTHHILNSLLKVSTAAFFSGRTEKTFEPEYISPNVERLIGFSNEELLQNPNLFNERIHPKDLTIYLNALKNVKSAGHFSTEYRFKHKNGHYVWLHDERVLVKEDEQGEKYTGFWFDVTPQKILAQQSERTQRLESLGTLAGGIAHDLNNVLTPILMGAELLKNIVKDPRALKSLTMMENSAKRGAELIKQVLAFARGSEGERAPLQIRYLIAEIIKMVETSFPKTVKIKTEWERDLWPVLGDATQLHQVFMNLLINARDAMPEGGQIRIIIKNIMLDEQYARSNIAAKPGPFVLVSVQDTGHGIPTEVIDKIFDPFFTTKEVGKGTGMGLATAHKVISEHGGFINVYSEPKKGTTFNIYLPASKMKESTVLKAEVPAVQGNGEWILLIEDVAAIREITQKTLESNGYQVLTAEDGPEGVAVFAENMDKIELVITDMVMPIMDGPAVIRALQRIKKDLKVIGMSGRTDEINNLKKKKIPFLQKPFTAQLLLEAVDKVLHKTE